MIPQIAAILGPCSGGASYSPALCDFVFMVKDLSKMCLTGPAVVESVLGIKTTLDELGGSEVHGKKSGVAHVVCEDEKTCLDEIRMLLTYLPQNCSKEAKAELDALHQPPRETNGWLAGMFHRTEQTRTPVRFEELVPDNSRRAYDVHAVIDNLLLNDSFYEIFREFAPNAVTGFGVMDHHVIGVVANQPMYLGGAIDYDAADKMARFIRFCDCFRIPMLTLVDVPAFFRGRSRSKMESSGMGRRSFMHFLKQRCRR